MKILERKYLPTYTFFEANKQSHVVYYFITLPDLGRFFTDQATSL